MARGHLTLAFVEERHALDAHHLDQEDEVAAHLVHPVAHVVDGEVLLEVVDRVPVQALAAVEVGRAQERLAGRDVVVAAPGLRVCAHFQVLDELVRFVQLPVVVHVVISELVMQEFEHVIDVVHLDFKQPFF